MQISSVGLIIAFGYFSSFGNGFSITGVSKNGKGKHPQREISLLLFRMHRITEGASGQNR